MTDDWRDGGFGLYVHWPFCAAKCPYCDFNSHVVPAVDQARWAAALSSEIARQAAEVPGRVLGSIFLGGGTPSLMAPETVASVIEAARRTWSFANDIEITLEANPTSVEQGRFAAYAGAGVNRLSMGIQALNDDDLRRLGRRHSVAEARVAFDVARNIFPRVSFDLIYARQGQERAAWREELREALSMAVDHLSLYQLTIEPGTAFGARHAAGVCRELRHRAQRGGAAAAGQRGLRAHERPGPARGRLRRRAGQHRERRAELLLAQLPQPCLLYTSPSPRD